MSSSSDNLEDAGSQPCSALSALSAQSAQSFASNIQSTGELSSTDLQTSSASAVFPPSSQSLIPFSTRYVAASNKKNYIWSTEDIVRLVTTIYSKERYQNALLPSREGTEDDANNKLRKEPVCREIFQNLFPGVPVDPNRIKTKLRWLITAYHKEKKKLSLTGAGTLLRDLDPSSPSYISRSALAQRLPWFEKMHEMMNGCVPAGPIRLYTTPPITFPDEPFDIAGAAPTNNPGYPMDESEDDTPRDHANHAHSVPPLLDMLGDVSTPPLPSQPGSNVAENNAATPTPSQRSSAPQDTFSPSASPSSSLSSPATKRKRGAMDQKRDSIAEAFYKSSVESLQIKLKVEQERTRREELREYERTKREQMRLQHEKDEKEREERVRAQERQMMLEMVRLFAGHKGVDPECNTGYQDSRH
ncbi:uncharacterized protein UTRI_00822 [Ustilago trichophora]|uniref:Uncharacterized protein n=1 Tax=Ustilago trichophora TaxID=86804 RepID=A0A5C3DSQ9_9BASI|nr:uncharacterized protein UTRI_00822 [Ustilago trichophora]